MLELWHHVDKRPHPPKMLRKSWWWLPSHSTFTGELNIQANSPNSSISEIIMTRGFQERQFTMWLPFKYTEQKQKFSEVERSLAVCWQACQFLSPIWVSFLSTLPDTVVTTHTWPRVLCRMCVCRLVAMTEDSYLWGNVIGSPTEGPGRDSIHHVFLAHPKVGDLDMPFWVQHDVIQLQVPAREQVSVRGHTTPCHALTFLQLMTCKDVCLAHLSDTCMLSPGYRPRKYHAFLSPEPNGDWDMVDV